MPPNQVHTAAWFSILIKHHSGSGQCVYYILGINCLFANKTWGKAATRFLCSYGHSFRHGISMHEVFKFAEWTCIDLFNGEGAYKITIKQALLTCP
jgi:hypothetical protein